MSESMQEYEVQELIRDNKLVQERIKELLNLKGCVKFYDEESYINGITADFTIVKDDKIIAIMECKAGDINITEYVRGIGQLFQYEYCFDKKVPHKSFEYSEDFKTIYFYPDSVITKSYNIGQFKYPETTTIFVLKEDTKEIQRIPKELMRKLEDWEDNLIMVSPYYVRDIRVFEYYMLLRYIFLQEFMGIEKLGRRDSSIVGFFKKIKSKNTNFTNGWITLSRCGLTKRGNLLTDAGKRMAGLDYEEFAVKMYRNFLVPYFNEILKCFDDEINFNCPQDEQESDDEKCEVKRKKICLTLPEWEGLIRKNNGNRDVCFLTDGEGTQSISSWLNIMRDDFGIIDFEANKHKQGVKLVYDPRELNDDALIEKVKEYSIGYEPLKNFQELLKKANITYDSVGNYEPFYIEE